MHHGAMAIGILVLTVVMLLGIQECGTHGLDPYCQKRGYDHGKYVIGAYGGGGSFCVAANGELTRVEGP